MKRGVIYLALLASVLVGCGKKAEEATAPAASGEATGAVQKGTAKAESGFSATPAGENAESRLGSK
jgi:hypothetical protein